MKNQKILGAIRFKENQDISGEPEDVKKLGDLKEIQEI